MTATSVRISASVQALIDARLDTIERMLLGRVSRQDRLAIVRDVETQIHELLQEHGDDEIGRDEMLAVLARLDPPEAYLPEEPAGELTSAPVRVPMPARPDRTAQARIARISGILGLSALAVLLLSPLLLLLAELAGSEELLLIGLFMIGGLVLVLGVLGLALGIAARRAGAWSLVGIVASVASLLFGFAAGSYVLLLFL
jgi:hypothetical protein